MSSRFGSLEDVVRDPVFPPVDLALRRGRHIDRDDGDWHAFVSDAQNHLEQFYRRFGCELVMQADGYFYLLPTGEQLARRQLSAGEMLVGQTLALQFLDPATIQSGGIVTREQVLARLGGLISDRELAKALEPRRRRFDDERIVHEIIRKRVAESMRRLDALGFIASLDADRLRLRAPLLRFAEPVRGFQDVTTGLERLILQGEAVDVSPSGAAGEMVADRSDGAAEGDVSNGEERADEEEDDEEDVDP